MRLILTTTIIITMLAQPVWAASTYTCLTGVVLIAKQETVEEFQNFEFSFAGDSTKVVFNDSAPFHGSTWQFSEGGNHIGDEFWLITQAPYDISF